MPGIGKTTSIHCLAHALLGDAYKEGVLELNASDERFAGRSLQQLAPGRVTDIMIAIEVSMSSETRSKASLSAKSRCPLDVTRSSFSMKRIRKRHSTRICSFYIGDS
jgi:DNA polymerase III delta prime subunit